MTITVKARSKNLRDVTLASHGSLESVLRQLSEANGRINTNRLRLTYKKDDKHVPITATDYFQQPDDVLYVKDLGPQISWRMVFVAEYLGPILVHTALYNLSQRRDLTWLHSNAQQYNPHLNRVAYLLVLIHYAKREFETLFVHSFSQSTMPLFNLFKNSFHYWVLNGMIGLGYFGYGFPVSNETVVWLYSKLRLNNVYKLIGLFLVSEIWNFYTHLQLRWWGDLQKRKGVTSRVPINSGIFKLLVAPNYTFEVWSWVWFALIMKLNLFALFFLGVSTTQMYLWAAKKNKRYGTRRAFLIPFVF
ncbi:AER215Wp [Eremothecium gossypii ATCC 10895]|uniref:AER215Wp n=1 Tax=Eremothecium gossypii (strain ATCC 10895 / CBS 109.51 / FGSC 9923 / NRRL Y-1056) TaxID=284811 RepID=Q756N9_EREGS|nr:AER215Wp [Eremothecium gossypii ATCC 10895]AAS52896.1 AER215Wp [Eremothecium gossypii ATCC 10895]AEY97204.1 FAER215Wp [Eremothecium gossypii FDAG1]